MTFVKQFSDEIIMEQRMLLSDTEFSFWFEDDAWVSILGYVEVINNPEAICIKGKHYVMLCCNRENEFLLLDNASHGLQIENVFAVLKFNIVDWYKLNDFC